MKVLVAELVCPRVLLCTLSWGVGTPRTWGQLLTTISCPSMLLGQIRCACIALRFIADVSSIHLASLAHFTIHACPFPSFNERVELIVEHERGAARGRAQAMASEERDLVALFRSAEIDYEARLSSQVTVTWRAGRQVYQTRWLY